MKVLRWAGALVTGLTLGQVAPVSDLSWRQLPTLPDAWGLASPFAGTAGGLLFVAGGANFSHQPLGEGGTKIWHREIFMLEPASREWKTVGLLPRNLAYGVSISTEDGLMCIGGSDSEKHYADTFLLRWEKSGIVTKNLPPLPRNVAMAAGALLGDVVYVAGGLETPSSSEPLSHFFAFDLKNPEAGWKELPSWPGPGRFQGVAAAMDGWFYLFSGLRYEMVNGKKGLLYLRDAYRYSPATGWEKLPDLPFAAAAAASPAPVGRDAIYLLGGVDGSGVGKAPNEYFHVPQRIQRYVPSAKAWHEAGNAPVGRVCVSTAFWQGAWILPSGERSPGIRSPEVWTLRVSE